MVIDFHAHTFPENIAEYAIEKLSKQGGTKAYTDGTEKDLSIKMKEQGVDYSVILPVATNVKQVENINRYSVSINEQTKETGLISFGAMHPDYSDYKNELVWLKNNGFKGIKLHPDYQGHFFEDIEYFRILDKAEELGLFTLIHAGVDAGYPELIHCTPAMIKKATDSIKPERLILAHMGSWGLWDEVGELLTYDKLYFDTAYVLSFISKEQFAKILNQHGSSHILFGTDTPWQRADIALEKLKNFDLDQESYDNITYKNAYRILEMQSL